MLSQASFCARSSKTFPSSLQAADFGSTSESKHQVKVSRGYCRVLRTGLVSVFRNAGHESLEQSAHKDAALQLTMTKSNDSYVEGDQSRKLVTFSTAV